MQLVFAEINRDRFEAIKNGVKKVETRAGSVEYNKIKQGDIIDFVCGEDKFKCLILKVKYFKTIDDLLNIYKYSDINLNWKSKDDAKASYLLFPNYESRIKEFGIIVFELE